MQWMNVSEHLPDEGKLVLAYSAVHAEYYVAKWSAARGWLDQNDRSMTLVTAWNDVDLPLNFPVTDELDLELAKTYGFKVGTDRIHQ